MKRTGSMFNLRTLLAGLVLGWMLALPAAAQYGGRQAESNMDPDVFLINEKKFLGRSIPKNVQLVDQNGEVFTLKDKLGKPTILILSYYSCDGSCSIVNEDLRALLEEAEGITLGQDFNVLTVSFDQHDTLETLGVFRSHLKKMDGMGENWTFATFKNPEEIEPFTKKIGYKFFWSPRDGQFLHPGVFLFLTSDGRLARVLYALNSEPNDVELAVYEAREGKFEPRNVINYAISLCYSYNYAEGQYTLNIPLFVGIGSLSLGISAFAVSVLVFRRRKMREENL